MSPPGPGAAEHRRLVNLVRITVASVLGGIGAAAGFTHTHEWAVHHGQTGWLAWATAVVIEGMAVVAGFEIQRDHARGQTRKVTFPMVVLVAAFGIQMAAQVALAEPSVAGWIVAAMPALGFLVVVKLLMRAAPASEPETSPELEPAPAAPVPPDPAPASADSEPTGAADPAPAPQPGRPSSVPRVKLPPELASRLDGLVDTARAEGRELTTEEIQTHMRVPGEMAARIADQLTARNGHPVLS
ncbi:hypothetical protein FHS23_002169 [Prauserella isguenensis]|uniref:DUF2637 domain-containing protein n=1 Tax=Prauserella isguenensis TaxID=1470180 RepID=A0A839S084_9PSEU|nr:DUF2637 domain-containing protein [Prauserella isguenensis]MBB3051146.1 hypothetical protein [Prauserella isguenensis]